MDVFPSSVTYGPLEDFEEPLSAPPDYDYPWVVAWGRKIHLDEDMIAGQVALAQTEQAPATALYKFTKYDEWTLLEDIERIETRYWLLDYARNFHLELPDRVFRFWMDPNYRPPDRRHNGP